jgi:hypothetical protein
MSGYEFPSDHTCEGVGAPSSMTALYEGVAVSDDPPNAIKYPSPNPWLQPWVPRREKTTWTMLHKEHGGSLWNPDRREGNPKYNAPWYRKPSQVGGLHFFFCPLPYGRGSPPANNGLCRLKEGSRDRKGAGVFSYFIAIGTEAFAPTKSPRIDGSGDEQTRKLWSMTSVQCRPVGAC